MAFPTSPTNGQQANINGITYTYSNTVTAWTVSTSVSNTFVSINVSDNVNSGNVLATGVISATGNVSGGNLVVTGNIIDTGALTIVTGSNGNITLSPNGTGIVTTTGAISTTGNISANNATFTSNQTLSYGTANGVAYLNSSKVLTTGSALVFDGTSLGVGVTPSAQYSGIKSVQVGSTTNLFDTGTGTKLYHNAYTAASGDETYLTSGYAQGYLMPSNGQHIWYIGASGTAGNTFSFTTALTINTNGVVALSGASTSATGVGITFPATQSASTNAKTLDDYEEGTWPAAFVPSTSGTITLSNNTGTYTKIGRTVTINAALKVASVSSPVGYFTITGLPFSGGTGATFRCSISILGDGMQATMTTSLTASMQSGSVLYVFKYSGTGSQVACAQDIQANTEIFIGGTYLTD